MNSDPWEALGELDGEEALHVLTRLYGFYEQDPVDDPCRERLFTRLLKAVELARECNLNRR